MKKKLIYSLLAAATLWTGCTQEQLFDRAEGTKRVAVSINDDAETKVNIDGANVTWDDDDKITIAEVKNGAFVSLKEYEIDPSSISNSGKDAEFEGDEMTAGSTYIAVTGENIKLEDGKLSIDSTTDDEQDDSAEADHFEDEWFMTSAPFSVTGGAMPKLQFKNQQSVLSLELKMAGSETLEIKKLEFASPSAAFASKWTVSADGSIAPNNSGYATISQELDNATISSSQSYTAKLPIWWNPSANVSANDSFTTTLYFTNGKTAQAKIDAKDLESGKLYKASLTFEIKEEGEEGEDPAGNEIIQFEDAAFEAALLKGNYPLWDEANRAKYIVDTNNDGKISMDEAAAATHVDVSGESWDNLGTIKFMPELQYFTVLEVLFCSNIPLESLDVSKNTALEKLYCQSVPLTTLDVSKNTKLTELWCRYNPLLKTLDVSKNTKLTELHCNRNSLTALDVTKNAVLKVLYCDGNSLTTLDVRKNAALERLYCDENALTTLDVSKNAALERLYCDNNSLTTLDVSMLSKLEKEGLQCGDQKNGKTITVTMTQAQKALPVLNPDSNNRVTVSILGGGDDDPAVASDRAALMAIYNQCGGANWKDRTNWGSDKPLGEWYGVTTNGSGRVTKINLQGEYNNTTQQFESFGLTGDMPEEIGNLTELTYLNCVRNSLTTIDISNNTKLTEMWCYGNALTTLDVSKNTALTELNCSSNSLTSLDISKNTKLTELSCSWNSLTTLDVTKNAALTKLYCYGNALTTLDVSKNTALTELDCGGNALTSLDLRNNTELIELECNSSRLSTLDVSKNTALIYLNCGYNYALTTLDVSKNTKLTVLWCYSNSLTTLDVSNNTELTELSCWGNSLTTLDVSMLTKLGMERLLCGSQNKTITVTMTEAQEALPVLSSSRNDRVTVSILGGEGDDNEDPAVTTDRAALMAIYNACGGDNWNVNINWGSDKPLSEWYGVATNSDGRVTELFLRGTNGPFGLTGDIPKEIGVLTELKKLYLYNNHLTSLDVSKNTKLTHLDCWGNSIKTLDVSKNTQLIYLYCYDNNLTTLDVSKNKYLKWLHCNGNYLTKLDVSMLAYIDRWDLWCGDQKDNKTITVTMTKAQEALPLLAGWGNDRVTVKTK